jgi:uncharacterized membrane protein SpoIIM required for sporulation
MNRFIDERKDNWQRLEYLLEMLRGSSLKYLSKTEVREFGELYRRAATDLAIARAETRDPKLVNYLNSLVIRAHGKVYRSEGEGVSIIRRFFTKELPQELRSSSRYSLTAFAVFMVFGVISFFLCLYAPDFSTTIGLDAIQSMAESNTRWWESLNDANQIGASRILTNNIQVAIMAFAFGAFFGVGTLYILMMNGVMIGGVVGVCYRVDPNFGAGLVNFMVAHGVMELTAIFLAGGAGMMIGYALIDPGDLTRGQALKKAGQRATKIIIGCAVILVITGIIEGFLSPTSVSLAIKYGTGVLTGVLFLVYATLVGREETDAVAT